MDSQLSVTVLNALLGKRNQFDDLVYFDAQLLRSLKQLRRYATAEEKDADTVIESLGLTFEVAVGGSGSVGHGGLGSSVAAQVELIPGGASIAVTKDNMFSYIYKLANYKLNEETKDQMRALVQGFREVVRKHWVLMFSAAEMQMLIGGEMKRIDLEDMQRYCSYGGGYHPSQPYIQVSELLLMSFVSTFTLLCSFLFYGIIAFVFIVVCLLITVAAACFAALLNYSLIMLAHCCHCPVSVHLYMCCSSCSMAIVAYCRGSGPWWRR